MAIQKTTPVAITIGTAFNSLGSSATAAAQSNEVTSSTTTNVTDITVNVSIVTGSYTQTGGTILSVYVWGTNDTDTNPGTSGTIEAITGTAGAITLSLYGSIGIKHLLTVSAASSQTNRIEGSVCAALGFVPSRWGIVLVNLTGAALAASGHSAEFVEVYYT